MSTCGEMLRLARQRLGFSQKEAAEELNIKQPVLSRIENGVADSDNEILSKAAKVYGVPVSFFEIKDSVFGPPVSVHPMLRGKADVTARDLDMITAELNIRVFHLRQFLDVVDFEPKSSIPLLDVEQYGTPEKIAAVVRSHWGVPSGPIKNIISLMEHAGIIVAYSDFRGASVSGITFRVPGRPPIVLINDSHPADRVRFTLAHELGHLVMHRFPNPDMEREANEFASAFLMPKSDIIPSLAGRNISLMLLASLKPEWKVAMQALLMRAKSLNLLSKNQERYLWQQISKRGWRTREPADLDFLREEPKVLSAIINAQFSELGYTISELAQFSRVYESEFQKLYGNFGPAKPTRPKLRIVS